YAVDYTRAVEYSGTHECTRGWSNFRLSAPGRGLKRGSRPAEASFRFLYANDSTPRSTLYNADPSNGRRQNLYARHPPGTSAVINLENLDLRTFQQLADHERFQPPGLTTALHPHANGRLELPTYTCGLWIETA